MTRWPDGPPARVPSPRSAHGPDTVCGACRDCPSCDGGTAVLPDTYRPTPHGPVCTRCHGTAVTCTNLTRQPAPATKEPR